MERDGFAFRVEHRASASHARAGVLMTPHGSVRTPAFMPVGTKGSVKGVAPSRLRELGTQMVLANTYHLHLRPGEDLIAELGGLHRFTAWSGPLLTDSGGYQVFSLSDIGRVDEDGVTFRSVVDGASVRFEPESVMAIQAKLGADIAMAFDHCPPDPRDRPAVEAAWACTARWL
jgi:queuine tRNA-ribosyltransferase